jgi:hypothetical protein
MYIDNTILLKESSQPRAVEITGAGSGPTPDIAIESVFSQTPPVSVTIHIAILLCINQDCFTSTMYGASPCPHTLKLYAAEVGFMTVKIIITTISGATQYSYLGPPDGIVVCLISTCAILAFTLPML